ncbi:MAG: hypothetical protein LQ343_001750 [Gyalolechia ehrenbergii]|nr:MAG: hypothetical protein LQ343_001750 [Gyalolechia ehrenbergii]
MVYVRSQALSNISRLQGGLADIRVVIVVYTCQQAQPKRCDFFLWDDDAKPREAKAVLSNSRTEPLPAPQTPTKSPHTSTFFGLQTPYTDSVKSHRSPEPSTPQTPCKSSSSLQYFGNTQNTSTTLSASDEEFFDWPASDDEDVFKAVDEASLTRGMPPPETPSKLVNTAMFSSPVKRRFSQMDDGSAIAWPTPPDPGGDIFVTPNTGVKRDGPLISAQTLSSPVDTPTPGRFKDALQASQDSELTSEILKVLQDSKVLVNSDVKAALKAVCDKHSLSTRGIMKGRDMSRAMVTAKNGKISELQETITTLQAERDTNRAVIRHLRRDMGVVKDLGV